MTIVEIATIIIIVIYATIICLLKIRRVSLKAYENYEDRLKMAEMHDDILDKIKSSYNNGSYIETCWLCYACFENRVERIMKCLTAVMLI